MPIASPSPSRLVALLSLAAASAALAAPPQDAFLYCLRDGQGDPTQNRLDIADLTAEITDSHVVTLPGFEVHRATGLARRASDGALFAILRASFPGGGTDANFLVTLNPDTGDAAQLGILPDEFAGLTFGLDGMLYGVTDDNAADRESLYRISATTAAVTRIFPLRHGGSGEAIATANDGLLLHASGPLLTDGGNENLRVVEFVNLASVGGVTDINTSHETPFNFEVVSLAWSHDRNTMYLATLRNEIYSISRTTGASTFVAHTSLGRVKGMAFDGPTLYAVDSAGVPPSLFTLDLATGDPLTTVPIAATGFDFTGSNGLALQPGTHALFAILGVDIDHHRALAVINPVTGAADVRGILPDRFAGLAFRASGVLIGVTGDGADDPSALYTIDPLTAAATPIRSLGNGDAGEAIAIADDGFLYHASGITPGNQYFERVDLGVSLPPRFQPILTANTHTFPFFNEVLALGWSDTLGKMFLTERADALHTISLAAPAVIGPTEPTGRYIKGIAFAGPTMFALVNETPCELLTMQANTGATLTSVGVTLPGFTIDRANGLARHPLTGQLFAILTDTAGARHLVTVNPATGAAANIAFLTDKFAGLAFRASGALIGVTGDGAADPSSLFSINTASGAAAFIQHLGNGADGEAIAIAADGFLYHASGIDPRDQYWERVNLDTHDVADIAVPGSVFPFAEVTALATRPSSLTAFVADVDGDLWTLNTTTGAATFVAEFRELGGPDVIVMKGMAFVPAPCAGDTNGDGVVDFIDLNRVLSAFGTSVGNPNFIAGADLDHDGDVDFIDLNIILSFFGTAC